MSKQKPEIRGQRPEISGRRVATLMLAVVMVMTAWSGWAGDAAAVRVRPPESQEQLAVPLPPLAAVTGTDGTKKTWQQTGTMVGSIDVARADFRHSLRAGGWKLDNAIAVGR